MARHSVDGTSDDLMHGTVVETYELSPMQQGMLYHTLDAPRSGIYCVQVSYRIRGPLVPSLFVQAWQDVVARHPILRTSFHWQDGGAPVQRVRARAVLDVRQEDWRRLSPVEQRIRLESLLQAEGRTGFDLSQPPLMRLTLVRCEDDVHELVVAHHHLVIDGTCKGLLFQEVFGLYEARRLGRPVDLDPPRPYREFIAWLREQDLGAAETFWRNELAGVTDATPLGGTARDGPALPEDYAEHGHRLDAGTSDALRQFGRRHRLTLNTIVTGMWAIVLSRASRRDRVVFGATVNGRPASLAGAESMVGVFINTLPIRVDVAPAAPVAAWLQGRQMHHAALRDYDFAPLSQIQRWSAVPPGQPLVESLVVFENNSGYGSSSESFGSLEIVAVRPVSRNSFPLTVRCVPGDVLAYDLLYDTRRFPAEDVRVMAEQLTVLLRHLPDASETTVGKLRESLDRLDEQRRADAAAAFDRAAREKLRALSRSRLSAACPQRSS